MNGEDRTWVELRIGITPDEALELLDALATDEELREELEQNPRETLLRFNIDISPEDAPARLQLPPPEAIQHHADSLREREPFGDDASMPHGFAVLFVAHGNGAPQPRPPKSD